MKIQDPQKYLQRNSVFKDGDSMKLKFTLPKIESEKYGVIDGLSGEIPLLLKHGENPSCPFYTLDSIQQDRIIKSFYPYILSLDENLDDQKLYNVSLFNIVATLSYLPTLQPETQLFTLMVKIISALVHGDDGIDDDEFMSGISPKSTLGKLTRAVAAGQSGDLETFSKIGLAFPPLEPAIKLMTSFFEMELKDNPSVVEKYYWFFTECLEVLTAQLLIFSKANPTTRAYKESTWNLLCGINKALGLPLEVSAGLQNLNVPRIIREWLPFKQLINCFHSINSGLNDIKGIGRDVQKCKVSDSSILSKIRDGKDKDLRSAFNSVLISVQDNYTNLISWMNILEETYPENDDLRQYLKIVKVMLDGQVYGYFGFPYINLRYGEGGEYDIVSE